MPRFVAILEDDPSRIAAMRYCLGELLPNCEQQIFEDAAEMIAWLGRHLDAVALISLDHDLPFFRNSDGTTTDCGTGRQVANYLCTVAVPCPVIVHSSNNVCAPGMIRCLRDAGVVHARVYPHYDTEWIRSDWVEQIKAYVRGGLIALEKKPSR
ncbi:MAG: cyclic-phosphate processing receiver domain-containing protein [Tepidisphaeraceae bacterium]